MGDPVSDRAYYVLSSHRGGSELFLAQDGHLEELGPGTTASAAKRPGRRHSGSLRRHVLHGVVVFLARVWRGRRGWDRIHLGQHWEADALRGKSTASRLRDLQADHDPSSGTLIKGGYHIPRKAA